jgi:hypothetical protein
MRNVEGMLSGMLPTAKSSALTAARPYYYLPLGAR